MDFFSLSLSVFLWSNLINAVIKIILLADEPLMALADEHPNISQAKVTEVHGELSPCSVTCGTGSQLKTTPCNDSSVECIPKHQWQPCTLSPCQGRSFILLIRMKKPPYTTY